MKSPVNPAPRVLIVMTQYEQAGAQKVALAQAAYLHQHGYAVALCFLYDRWGDLPKVAAAAPFPIWDLQAKDPAAGRLRNLWRAARGYWRLFWRMRGGRFQAVESLTHYSNVTVMPLAWLAGIPVRIASQRNTLSEFPAWFWRLDAAIVNSPLCTLMTAVSAQTRHFCITVEGMRAEKVVTIPNGVDTEQYRPDPALRRATRAALGILEHEQVVLTVARLHPQKNHRALISAIQQVQHKLPNARFYWVGDGDLRPELEAAIASAGLQARIVLLGRRNDIPALLNAADLFVLPSLSEGMPNVVLEAMASGLPVLATAVDGTGEIIVDRASGWLVPPDDPAALAEGLQRLLGDPSLRQQIATAGRARVEAHFSEAVLLARFEQLLQTHIHAKHLR